MIYENEWFMNGNYFIIDCETNGLLSDLLDYSSFPYKLKPTAKLHCVVIRNYQTNEVFSIKKEEISKERLRNILKNCTHLVAHNGIKFDFLVLKLFGVLNYTVGYLGQKDTVFDRECTLIDTLILSQLFYPDRAGHSLEWWGQKLGNKKTDLRQSCIDAGIIDKNAPVGEEFKEYSEILENYCIQDTAVNKEVLTELSKELSYSDWKQAIRLEHKLADIAIRRENFGFWFDTELALKLADDLSNKMNQICDKINPILPKRKMNKGELFDFTPPLRQFKQDGTPTTTLINFVQNLGADLVINKDEKYIIYEGKKINLPATEPLKTEVQSTIEDTDSIKEHLLNLGWKPTFWNERDLTKDSKKKSLLYSKRIEALERWVEETFEQEKYKKQRTEIVGIKNKEDLLNKFTKKLQDDRAVIVPTTPQIKVGIERELCPNLVKLGEKVEFAKDYGDYLTYKYRLASIAGGDLEEIDLSSDIPKSGYLSLVRAEDGRISTPAIEIGAASNRYVHRNVVNIPRVTSLYGKEMRSLFGSGKDFVHFGYDFSSLEARISGHYVFKYPEGKELAEMFAAEKPNDLHSRNSIKLGIPRAIVKSLTFAILYGAQPPKIAKMLSISLQKAKDLYNEFWESVPALKRLKDALEKHWLNNNKEYIRGIDGRKIFTRSQHSLLNFLFQSGGVICAKYVHVLSHQKMEESGYCLNPFEGKPDICSMIEYHDEVNLAVNPQIIQTKMFKSEEEGKDFIKNWNEPYKLSQLVHNKNIWYIVLPNDVSKTIQNAIRDVEKLLNLNVPLDYEFAVGRNWSQVH